ncbi:putative hypothetical protein [Streptomyces sp. NBRC 110611]|uniref:hypothetical protein n=1 Tax=Streptomyces sp. NBRC 110611 TaxID=1621259 RepID=UPI0008323DE9|nr:hypothetical protein [Streptomyces sp. NBRC 110611]GAU67479.1 putative hypothetical protein [Streptomyces sp. NBRC 110611]
MTRTRKSFVATGIALLALGAVALPAAAAGHAPGRPHSVAIWDNHAPVIPLDNHAPLRAMDNHAPLVPVDNHMP